MNQVPETAPPPEDARPGLLKRTTAADRGLVERPVLTPHLAFRPIEDGQVLLVSETFNTLLRGPIHSALLPLLDGRRSHRDIVAALAPAHSALDVRTAIVSLAARGYVVSGDFAMDRGRAAYWSSLGVSPRLAEERLSASSAAITGDTGRLARRLDAMGVTVDTEHPSLTVVVCADYLEEAHHAVNRRHIASGGPWMLVRPKGMRPLFGPVFRPAERGPCWACLAYRLRGHQEVHDFLRSVAGDDAALLAHAAEPALVDAVCGFVAAEVVKWLVLRDMAPIHERVISFDVGRLSTEHHPTMRRPQCFACGDEALYRPDRPPVPVRLRPSPTGVRNSGGLHSVPPEETLARYRHLVSPVSGVVTWISRTTDEADSWLHVHWAGSNPALRTSRLSTGEDGEFRERLLANPKDAVEREFGVTLAEGHEIHVHEETDTATHVVLPPRSRFTAEEREEARTGAASLEFLKKTMYDPAPPIRPPAPKPATVQTGTVAPETLAAAGSESMRRGLAFLESTIDENGAWHCIRFNVANPDIPRHFERPPFVSALCVLALEGCCEARARAMCARTRAYLADTIEYPGMWRYYRHLPQDLDSTALCSLAVGTHPWILLGRNVPRILANRDREGRFMTWMLGEDEPDVATAFRIEADPVVNANVIAYLGGHPETRDAQRWLEATISEGRLDGSSKWYPDTVTIYHAITRAMIRARPTLDHLRPMVAERILGLRDENGGFGNVLQTAQAMSALYCTGGLGSIDAKREVGRLMDSQRDDGSWPELLAFGDQSLRWGATGQIGHGSESVTSAFCIEALACLVRSLGA